MLRASLSTKTNYSVLLNGPIRGRDAGRSPASHFVAAAIVPPTVGLASYNIHRRGCSFAGNACTHCS